MDVSEGVIGKSRRKDRGYVAICNIGRVLRHGTPAGGAFKEERANVGLCSGPVRKSLFRSDRAGERYVVRFTACTAVC